MKTRVKKEHQFAIPAFDPNNLINMAIDHLKLKNDAALARVLDVAPPVISKIRHKKIGIGPDMLIRLHDATGLSINTLRRLMGVPAIMPMISQEN